MRRWKGILLLFLVAAVAIWKPEAAARETVLAVFERANFSGSCCHIYREGYLDDNRYTSQEKELFLRDLGTLLKNETQKTDSKNTDSESTGSEKNDSEKWDSSEAFSAGQEWISEEMLESGSRIVYEWMAVDGSKSIRLGFLTLENGQGNYLRAEIFLRNEMDAGKALAEQKKLEESTEASGLESPVFLELSGYYEGELPRAEQRAVVEALLEEMGAVSVEEVDEPGLYTVYAYAKDAGKAENVAGKAVNLNLAVTCDEADNRTVFYIGCPFIGTAY